LLLPFKLLINCRAVEDAGKYKTPGCFRRVFLVWLGVCLDLLELFILRGFWMEQRLARSRCYYSIFVLSTFFIQVPLSSYKLAF
jgi:hypothetical protein